MDCCRHLNPFKLCRGLRVIGYAMVLIFLAIVALSYYTVVVVEWVPRLLHGGRAETASALFVLIVFHLLLALLLWSYFMVVIQDPGSVPENWGASFAESDLESGRPGTGYCNRCQNGKPPRCHHCSICQRCVLKMDHHCVWVVNCIGARNYKYFLLFVLYAFLETVLDSLALLPFCLKFFSDAKNHSGSLGIIAVTFVAFVLNLAFALSFVCFLVLHGSLLLSNTTSIEVYEKRKSSTWKYNLGKKRNFLQVFGTKRALWFLPLYSNEDIEKITALSGLEFPVRSSGEG